MKLNFARVYKNFPYAWIILGLCSVFLLLLRAVFGSSAAGVWLNQVAMLGKSVGVFAVALPLLILLIQNGGIHKKLFAPVILLLNISSVVLGLFFLSVYHNDGFFGFAQAPQEGAEVFWLSLGFALLAALLQMAEVLLQRRIWRELVMPWLGLFAAVGIGWGLLVLQIVFYKNPAEFYRISLPVSEFLKQLVMVTALCTVLLRVLDNVRAGADRWLRRFMAVSAVFLLLGFQDSSLLINGSTFSYLYNQAFLSLGFAGFYTVFVILLMRKLRICRRSFLYHGEWTPLLLLFIFLSAWTLASLGPGKVFFSGALFEQIPFVVIAFMVPAVFHLYLDKKPPQSLFVFSLTQWMIWCGAFVLLLSLTLGAVHGAGLGTLARTEFRPVFQITLMGLFMVLVSIFAFLWDRILSEISE